MVWEVSNLDIDTLNFMYGDYTKRIDGNVEWFVIFDWVWIKKYVRFKERDMMRS